MKKQQPQKIKRTGEKIYENAKARNKMRKGGKVGKSSRRRVSAPWGRSFHGHRERGAGRGRGCPSPRLCPACCGRAGGQGRAASCAHRPPRPRCERTPRAGGESLQRRSDGNSIFLPLSSSSSSSSLRGRWRLLAASANAGCAPPSSTPPPHVRNGSPDHSGTDPRLQREREEGRRRLKGRGERKVRPRRL